MIHNTVRGSFGVGGFAAITVNYPVGGVCTCSLGDTTLTHSGGGITTFFVPNSGRWFVRAYSGSLSATAYVNIQNAGDNKYALLTYDISLDVTTQYLNSFVTHGSSYTSATIAYGRATIFRKSGNSAASVYTRNKIDLTGYSKIRVHISSIQSYSDNDYILVGINPVTNPAAAEKYAVMTRSAGWKELNVSDITGEYFIQIGSISVSTGDGQSTFEIDAIELIAED